MFKHSLLYASLFAVYAVGIPVNAKELLIENVDSTADWGIYLLDGGEDYVIKGKDGISDITVKRNAAFVGGIGWRYPSNDRVTARLEGIDKIAFNIHTTQSGGTVSGFSGNQANLDGSNTDIVFNLEFTDTDILKRGTSYGVVSGSTVDAGISQDTANFSSKNYVTTTVNNLDISMKTNGGMFHLQSGLRAIQGAYNDTGAGPAGQIVVKGDLTLSLDGGRQEGIYISGQGDVTDAVASRVILEGDSTITLNNGKGSDNSAIKVGKSRAVGSGRGELYSYGNMHIDMANTSGSAIKLAVNGTKLIADSDTSSTTVISNGNALNVGQNDWGVESSSDDITASFNNASFSTTSSTSSLLKVYQQQTGVSFNFKGEQTQLNMAEGSSAWVLDVDNDSSVNMTLSDGEMKGLVNKADSATVDLALSQGARWTLQENGDVSTTLTKLSLEDGGVLDATYSAGSVPTAFVLNGDVNSLRGGLIMLSQSGRTLAGDILTINGNYTGGATLADAGRIALDTALGNDGSLTDKLMINGMADGYTKVSINNVGGLGAGTLEGIEIITTQGTTADAFSQEGRVVAGSYDYSLVNKGTNWYLTSQFIDPTVPTDPDPDPDPGTDPDPEPGESIRVLRPEIGSYLANAAAGNTLFTTRLHDRLGETQYTDALTSEKLVTSMWMRNEGGRNSFRDGSGQLKTTGNRYVVQIGGDLAQWSTDGLNRWHLGAMAGYANAESKTHSRLKGHESKSKIDGYSAGLYGTWYANAQDKSGAYVDSWVLYNWFDNEVKGDDLKADNYKSRGVTASLETGYSFRLGGSENANYWLSPRAQAVWMGVGSDSHRDAYGTRVQDGESNNLLTRLGLKAYASGRADTDSDKQRTFQPFVEVNWLHYMKDVSVKLDNDRHYQDGAKNIGEVKLGVEGQLTSKLNVWGNVAQQVGDSGYHDSQAMLGVKYSF
ncbi:autotransporter outer membrane beta-barrel domain-containing protein [Leminorella richardii]|uniref:autotransporter outer membrane beta-barrel domain-containing protein n=1 Tax=Leminorella richardii TaxID=158841 RepID=UPI001475589F|nr:autotransporter outer membrane beta-barrel domain-containing protein [Leminorella richardii]